MSIAVTQPAAGAEAAQRASGSSFYTAMRILPAPQRRAMFEIYSFCRKVDDIADDPGERSARLAALWEWRRDIDALYAGAPRPELAGLAASVGTFGLRREDFHAVIEGMEMDATGDIRAPTWSGLDTYCDRVASAVGRLSVRVFGMPEEEGERLAHHLGRALQLTNILRDIDEDASIGRLYLPMEALSAAGIAATDPAEVVADRRLPLACAPVVEQAKRHFSEADAIMARHHRRVVRAPRIMGAAYRLILDGLAARGFDAPRKKVGISKPRLLAIILRYAIV